MLFSRMSRRSNRVQKHTKSANFYFFDSSSSSSGSSSSSSSSSSNASGSRDDGDDEYVPTSDDESFDDHFIEILCETTAELKEDLLLAQAQVRAEIEHYY